jgi:hypothetical protein
VISLQFVQGHSLLLVISSSSDDCECNHILDEPRKWRYLCAAVRSHTFRNVGFAKVGQLRSAAGKELAGHCKERTRVKNRKPSKADRLDGQLGIGVGSNIPEAVARCCGQFQEFTTVITSHEIGVGH